MTANECYDYFKEEIRNFPYLCHAKNILAKKDKNEKFEYLNAIVLRYYNYYSRNKQLSGIDDETIYRRVEALNDYYNFLHDQGYDNIYSAQSKFRPTILEEFMSILFKDYLHEVQNSNLGINDIISCGAVKAYTNLFFFSENFNSFIIHPDVGINQKDQDFAIYRKTELQIDNSSHSLCLPVVAIENKTYIDKTMLEGAVATADKIKVGNPYCLYCVVTETYDVSLEVDPAYSRIDQIFVLRKTTRRAPWQSISNEVVKDFVKFVINHLERPWSDVANKLRTTGKLI